MRIRWTPPAAKDMQGISNYLKANYPRYRLATRRPKTTRKFFFCLAASIRVLCAPLVDTFTNPLLPHGADPYVMRHGGFYYYMQTTGNNLTLWKTRDITDLAHAQRKVIWTPPLSGPYSRQIWAPEIHWLNDKWYVYFAADNGSNETHRIWVIENGSADAMDGDWMMRGKVTDAADRWAIDATVFRNGGHDYMVWSGWPGSANGTQNLYLARLRNPWTIAGERVLISTPQLDWEKFGDLRDGPVKHVNVNEGPEVLAHAGKLFLTYSASGCWTDHYALGMLVASVSSDLENAASWRKSPKPVFSMSATAHAYGTGHNGFFQSPDGKQDWLIYHANPDPNQGCDGARSPRAQPIRWDANGVPDFGVPVAVGQALPKPSR